MSLQPERTDLAWRRTGIATVGLALVGLKLAATEGGIELVSALVATATAVAIALLARWRSAQLLSAATPPAMPRRAGLLLAGTVVVLDLAGVALVLGAPG